MNTADSVRRGQIVAAIARNPGITKRELMNEFGITIKALEMHLVRLTRDGEVFGELRPGEMVKAWYVGPHRPNRRRVASVFDLAMAMQS